MRKTSVWMPLYIADYLADTTRLTTEQHGAYLLLIMDYWRNGALPDDDDQLAQITRLSASQWKRHRPTLARMFEVLDGEWRHKRIEEELAEAAENARRHSLRARNAAERRWDKHRESDASGNATSMPVALLEKCPSPSPSPSPKEKKENTLVGFDPPHAPPQAAGESVVPVETYPPEFEAFWKAYPRKVGKLAALRAYRRAVKLMGPEPHPRLLAAAVRYAKACAGKEEQYIAHAQTWLNQGRWGDEPATVAAKPSYVPMAANGG